MEEVMITSDIVSEICGYIRVGASFEISAIAAGYKQEQVQKMNDILLSANNGIWKEFADDIKKASAQFKVMQLMKINAEGGARGAQWLLDKVRPEKLEKESLPSSKDEILNQKQTFFSDIQGWPGDK